LNNGGGQRLDVTDEGNVFMMFSPAEHTDSMKRRKDRKRRERNEKRNVSRSDQNNNDSSNQASEQKTPEREDKSSLSLEITPPKSNTLGSSSTVVISNPSPRSVHEMPDFSSKKNDTGSPQRSNTTQHPPGLNLDDYGSNNYNYDNKFIEPTSRAGSHRGSARVIIHESRQEPSRQQSTKWEISPRSGSGVDRRGDGTEPESFCNANGYCDEIPADDDDVWYTKWWSFCFHDGVKSTTSSK
jgi:hypothetical protein